MAWLLSVPDLARLREKLEAANLLFPREWDFEWFGGCDRRCEYCWGPRHNVRRVVPLATVLQFAWITRALGSKRIIFTGGEPLIEPGRVGTSLRDDELLAELNSQWAEKHGEPLIDPECYDTDRELDLAIVAIRKMGIDVTLSTGGVGLLARPLILGNITGLGVDLDGDTAEHNAQMRPPAGHVAADSNFNAVLEILRVVPKLHPHVQITLRSVVTAQNIDWVLAIPAMLMREGIDTRNVRWKLYQVNMDVQTHLTDEQKITYAISNRRFRQVVRRARRSTQDRFKSVVGQLAKESGGRYVIANPTGVVRILRRTWRGRIEECVAGSMLEPEGLISRLNTDYRRFMVKQAKARRSKG